MKTKKKPGSINIVTLGCSKNTVDSEKLMGQLRANNLKVVYDSNNQDARTVVINTCGFISDAKQESIDTILQYVNAKENGLIDDVFVMGCLSERYKDELKDEIPQIDALFGVNNIEDIVKKLGGKYKNELIGERLVTTPAHYAYLKISEGCDRNCSFCAIPLIRGKHKSKTIEQLLTESQKLAEKGVKELILIAQDLTYYGVDIYKKQALSVLLNQLSDVKGIEWIRLHYAYPQSFPEDVLKVVMKKDNICKYIDIPFQHISDVVLRNMRRGINSSQTYELIHKIRKYIPDITLRTTLLVGHPGEGDKEFDELCEFVKNIEFDRLGVFTYSEEEDTYAAENFSDTVPENVKQERAAKIMEIQEKISYKKNQLKIGKCFKTIIDRQEGDSYIGRTEGDSPEVDNEIHIKPFKGIEIGSFYSVKIVEADSFDLFAEVQF